MLALLPTELILQIICNASPEDIPNLQLVSSRFSRIIQNHEQFLYEAIAQAKGLSKCRPFTPVVMSAVDSRPRQLINVLIIQSKRHRSVKQLLPALASNDDYAERSLELLWEYHEALNVDSQELATERHRLFVKSISLEELIRLMNVIRSCGDLIAKVLASNRYEFCGMQWFHQPCALMSGTERDFDTIAEAVVTKGFNFLVSTVVKRSPEALAEMEKRRKPIGKTVMSRLHDERRWKSRIAFLQANALLDNNAVQVTWD